MEQPKESTVLVREASPAQVKIYRLEDLRKECLARADAMVSGKGSDYGHFSSYSEIEIASLLRVKSKRSLELAIKRHLDEGTRAKFEGLEDTCLDGTNYFSFLYSIVMGRKEGLL